MSHAAGPVVRATVEHAYVYVYRRPFGVHASCERVSANE